jgi:hypothetical protein
LYFTDLRNISEASNAMATVPSAQYMKDPEPVGYHGRPPPTYDEAMESEHHMQYTPQPVPTPYSTHNGK